MEKSFGSDFTIYRQFLEDFAEKVNPNDQLPVRVPSHNITEPEIIGQIMDWTLQYLSEKKCPSTLIPPIFQKVLAETKRECRKNSNLYGCSLEEPLYEPLKLMQLVISKVNDQCHSLLDNAVLEKLIMSTPSMKNKLDVPAPRYAVSAIKNHRRKMEDRHIIIDDFNTLFGIEHPERTGYYGIFDGHAGAEAASYSIAQLHINIAESAYYPKEPAKALYEAIEKTDINFLKKCEDQNIQSGTTVLCALHCQTEKYLYVAWVGDSKALIATQGQVMQIVKPHKPDDIDEKNRIEKLGGTVLLWSGVHRVNGLLAISRAIGDLSQKKYICGTPDIACIPLSGNEDFIILASDGLWDYVIEDDVAYFVYRHVRENPDNIDQITAKLADLSQLQGSTDNITVIIVFLKDPHQIAGSSWPSAVIPSPLDNMETAYDNSNGAFGNANQDSQLKSDLFCGSGMTDGNLDCNNKNMENLTTDFNDEINNPFGDGGHGGGGGGGGGGGCIGDDNGMQTITKITTTTTTTNGGDNHHHHQQQRGYDYDEDDDDDCDYAGPETAVDPPLNEQNIGNDFVNETLALTNNYVPEKDYIDDTSMMMTDNNDNKIDCNKLLNDLIATATTTPENETIKIDDDKEIDVDGNIVNNDNYNVCDIKNKMDFSEKKEYSFEREEFEKECNTMSNDFEQSKEEQLHQDERRDNNADHYVDNDEDDEDNDCESSLKNYITQDHDGGIDDAKQDHEIVGGLPTEDEGITSAAIITAATTTTTTSAVITESAEESDDDWNYIKVNNNSDNTNSDNIVEKSNSIVVGEVVIGDNDDDDDGTVANNHNNIDITIDNNISSGTVDVEESHAIAQALAESQEACHELMHDDQAPEPELEKLEEKSYSEEEILPQNLKDEITKQQLYQEEDQERELTEEEMMASQLNPDAKEFIPTSPQLTSPSSPFGSVHSVGGFNNIKNNNNNNNNTGFDFPTTNDIMNNNTTVVADDTITTTTPTPTTDNILLRNNNIKATDNIIAQSPNKYGITNDYIDYENVNIPINQNDFNLDVLKRPAEIDDIILLDTSSGDGIAGGLHNLTTSSDNTIDLMSQQSSDLEMAANTMSTTNSDIQRPSSASSQCSYQEMNLKEAMHGDEKMEYAPDDDEYQSSIIITTATSLPPTSESSTEQPSTLDINDLEQEQATDQPIKLMKSLRNDDKMSESYYDEVSANNPFVDVFNTVQKLPSNSSDDDNEINNNDENIVMSIDNVMDIISIDNNNNNDFQGEVNQQFENVNVNNIVEPLIEPELSLKDNAHYVIQDTEFDMDPNTLSNTTATTDDINIMSSPIPQHDVPDEISKPEEDMYSPESEKKFLDDLNTQQQQQEPIVQDQINEFDDDKPESDKIVDDLLLEQQQQQQQQQFNKMETDSLESDKPESDNIEFNNNNIKIESDIPESDLLNDVENEASAIVQVVQQLATQAASLLSEPSEPQAFNESVESSFNNMVTDTIVNEEHDKHLINEPEKPFAEEQPIAEVQQIASPQLFENEFIQYNKTFESETVPTIHKHEQEVKEEEIPTIKLSDEFSVEENKENIAEEIPIKSMTIDEQIVTADDNAKTIADNNQDITASSVLEDVAIITTIGGVAAVAVTAAAVNAKKSPTVTKPKVDAKKIEPKTKTSKPSVNGTTTTSTTAKRTVASAPITKPPVKLGLTSSAPPSKISPTKPPTTVAKSPRPKTTPSLSPKVPPIEKKSTTTLSATTLASKKPLVNGVSKSASNVRTTTVTKPSTTTMKPTVTKSTTIRSTLTTTTKAPPISKAATTTTTTTNSSRPTTTRVTTTTTKSTVPSTAKPRTPTLPITNNSNNTSKTKPLLSPNRSAKLTNTTLSDKQTKETSNKQVSSSSTRTSSSLTTTAGTATKPAAGSPRSTVTSSLRLMDAKKSPLAAKTTSTTLKATTNGTTGTKMTNGVTTAAATGKKTTTSSSVKRTSNNISSNNNNNSINKKTIIKNKTLVENGIEKSSTTTTTTTTVTTNDEIFLNGNTNNDLVIIDDNTIAKTKLLIDNMEKNDILKFDDNEMIIPNNNNNNNNNSNNGLQPVIDFTAD